MTTRHNTITQKQIRRSTRETTRSDTDLSNSSMMSPEDRQMDQEPVIKGSTSDRGGLDITHTDTRRQEPGSNR